MDLVIILSILLLAFVVSLIMTWVLIPILNKKQMGQNIREEGPKSHQSKAGTPSMGGIGIIIAILVAGSIGGGFAKESLIIGAALIAFGILGFLDDYLKVIKKQNEGLTVIQKFGMQFLFAAGLAIWLYSIKGGEVYIPFWGEYIDMGWLFVPFEMFVIIAMTNGVNFTDGLDGLAGGTTVIVAVTLAITAVALGYGTAGGYALATAGACAGFLVFNKYPAKIFMGDTGSLALGGVITMTAAVMGLEFLLPLAGMVYVLEVLSVCIQVAVFKATKDEKGEGKRVFRMTPLHHHFQEGGMKETKVVAMFWALTLICCLLTLIFA